ncbi:hypothetical protein HX109_03320 [Galbibacter sp. BG1]|uniref:hypothetical protein n=1 Tax=Galbibacter sp. BG1 TaxID=1170699 RepID=UPI0015BDE03E|nr:hypothetical protein [Galbibacter sp. BG1]QLE00637.1 hypothetical protein HX109_03320 [Galbibacter sp. BG1]
MNLNLLQEKIENSKALDFGDIFGKCIELFKKSWGQGVLLIIVTFLLALPALLILYIPLIGAAAADSYSPDMSEEIFSAAMIPFVILFLPVILVVQSISLGLMAGFYKIVKQKDSGIETPTVSLFMYLKKPYYGKLFTLAFFSLVIALLATLLCFLPVIYVTVPLMFISVIFAFNPELSAKQILKAAFKLGNKKWLISFGLLVVASLLAQVVGFLLCGIGYLFTASFVYLPAFQVYKETVGFEDEDEISQIGYSEI